MSHRLKTRWVGELLSGFAQVVVVDPLGLLARHGEDLPVPLGEVVAVHESLVP